MWRTDARPWALHDPRFVVDELDGGRSGGVDSAHRHFVYDLVRWGSPGTIVEAGTVSGSFLFACCQAVHDAGAHASLHAVDAGESCGPSDDDTLAVIESTRMRFFPQLDVQLHAEALRTAREELADESVDLLQIGGYQSYEVAKDEYERWLGKLAPDGVVLFRDVAPWQRSASSQLWRDLSAERPSLTFVHSSGLGILFPKDAERFAYLSGDEFTRWKSYYAARDAAFFSDVQLRDQGATIQARDSRIGELEREAAGLRDEVDAVRKQLGAERAATGEPAPAQLQPDATTPAPAPVRRGLLRRLLRLLRRGARAANRHLGTNIKIGSGTDLDARIASVFDPEHYVDRYPDIALAGVDPLDHYLRRGWMEGRDPSPLFWNEWYVIRHPDVAAAGSEPLQHYLEVGWQVAHDPSPLLRTRWYRDTYPDTRASGLSPLEHFWTAGFAEGRFANPEQRRRLIAADSPTRSLRRTVTECEVRSPDQHARHVTLDAVARADVDLVTFDLWDTLITRSRPADAPKLATARRIWLEHGRGLKTPMTPWDLFAHRVEVEAAIATSTDHQEYRLLDVLTRHLGEVLTVSARKAKAAALDLAREEASEEALCTYRVDEVAAVLEALSEREGGPQLAVVSDFYLGGDDLRSIAEATGIDLAGIDVLVSCDLDKSKRVGGLYELARERAGVDASRHLHIGDNPWSDGEQQITSGGSAALITLSPSRLPGPGALHADSVHTLIDEERDELLSIVDVLAAEAEGSDTQRRAAHAGVLTAFLPVMLVAAAVEDSIERGTPTVHYLSREGAFLRQVHELVAPRLAGRAPIPVARHLEVSRRSTFGASIKQADPASLALMWSQYADQSPRAVFESLGVPVEPLADALTECGLTADGVVSDVARDDRIASLLEHPDVRSHADRVLQERRRTLLAYLRQEMDLTKHEALVVDVGWRGTIQDNLARVLDDHHLHGVYLGLFPFLNAQPRNVTKHAIAFDGNAGDTFVHVNPPAAIEAPLTPDLPSAVGYALHGDGRALVVRESEGPRASAEIHSFQAGVLAAAPRLADWLAVNGLTARTLRTELGEMVSEYYGHPEGGVADIWFDSTHDDTFGAFNVSPYAKSEPSRRLLSTVASNDAISDEARASNWVPGYRAWHAARAPEILRDMWRELR
jgi:FMN phosphatase YigB (HAD superfamily)